MADDDPLQMCSSNTTPNLQNTNCEPTGDIGIVTPNQENQMIIPRRLLNTTPSYENQMVTPSSTDSQQSQAVIPNHMLNAISMPTNQESQVVTPICPANTLTPATTLPVYSDGPEFSRYSSNDTASCLSSIEITNIYRNSCSRQNFSSRLVRRLFDEQTRKTSNVAGKLGKAQLNPVIISYVKSLTFQFFPLDTYEKLDKAWSICVGAIDEGNRRLNNKPTKKQLCMMDSPYM